MGAKFSQLTLGLIEEGRFLATIDKDLLEMQRKLIEYRKLHGDRATKAKATLTITIALQADKDENAFSILGNAKMTIPQRPPAASMSMVSEDENGQLALFVRNSGSTKDTPKQDVFTTVDGREVDLKTGEVVKEVAGSK